MLNEYIELVINCNTGEVHLQQLLVLDLTVDEDNAHENMQPSDKEGNAAAA